MDLKISLPTMADDELSNLRTNARRLIDSGTTTQKTAAAALMPSIEAELDARTAAKVMKRNEALALRRAVKGKPAASAESGRSEVNQA